jgi:hypothetical protein
MKGGGIPGWDAASMSERTHLVLAMIKIRGRS